MSRQRFDFFVFESYFNPYGLISSIAVGCNTICAQTCSCSSDVFRGRTSCKTASTAVSALITNDLMFSSNIACNCSKAVNSNTRIVFIRYRVGEQIWREDFAIHSWKLMTMTVHTYPLLENFFPYYPHTKQPLPRVKLMQQALFGACTQDFTRFSYPASCASHACMPALIRPGEET